MAKLKCKDCGKEKGIFRSWYRCSKHGVFCPDCIATTGLLRKAVCPKCGGNVTSV
jgi:hypothetical protein